MLLAGLFLIASTGPAGMVVALQQRRVTIHERIIIRVPRMSQPAQPISAAPPLPPLRWVERKAPRCVDARLLAAAAINRADSVDLVMQGGQRMRAKLDEDCPALDFYSGFYLRPADDGKLCAERDVIRARSGNQCRIEAFRRLVPER